MTRLSKSTGLAAERRDTESRRARTRLLIELGGLVVKAGLHNLVDDDRATLLGGFLLLQDLLAGADPEGPKPADLRLRCRRRGLRAFDADITAKPGQPEEATATR